MHMYWVSCQTPAAESNSRHHEHPAAIWQMHLHAPAPLGKFPAGALCHALPKKGMTACQMFSTLGTVSYLLMTAILVTHCDA